MICKQCGIDKDSDSFYYKKTTCKSCISIIRAQHYKENRDHILSVNNQHYHQNIEYCRKRQRDYYKEHLEDHRERSYIQRHIKRNVVPLWANKGKIRLIYKQARESKKHVDHIVPLISDKVCGLHCEANLQLLDPKLNISKGNRYWPDMPET